MKRRWKIALGVTIALVVLGSAGTLLHLPAKSSAIVISRETTVIDGPLNPDGTVNYTAAIDAMCSEGVTRENNAAVGLFKAFGPTLFQTGLFPDPRDRVVNEKILARLGLTFADIESAPFKDWDNRLTTQPATASSATSRRHSEPGISEVLDSLEKGRVHSDLRAWLADNQECFRLIEQASTLPRFYFPIISADDPPLFATAIRLNLSPFRSAAEAFACRAILRERDGDVAGAWNDILTMHRIARLVGQYPTLLGALLGGVIQDTAFRQTSTLITHHPLTPEKALAILRQLEALPPPPNVADLVDTTGRFGQLDSLMFVCRGSKIGPGAAKTSGLDCNVMLRYCNSLHDIGVKPLRLPAYAGRAEAQAACQKRDEQAIREAKYIKYWLVVYRLGGRATRELLSREFAKIIFMLSTTNIGGVADKVDATAMRFELEKLSLALACFHARQGRWPEKLQELSPELVKDIPADIFTGKALVYRPEKNGYLLYSLGPNQKDDAGAGDDIVTQVP